MPPSLPHARVFDRSTARPAPAIGPFSGFIRVVCRLYLAVCGWRLQADWPRGVDKAVLLAAPHTSNWDGFLMLVATGGYQVKLRWMGKRSLTQGPFGWLIKALGCVPVDRSSANDVVAQMKEAFGREKRLVLAIAPEGTRELVPNWRRGYYHIAQGAGVPIVLSVLDYGSKTISLSGAIDPTGDYDADFAWIRQHYEGAVRAKRPEQFTTGT
jgi:1-acyl-sn-glycerol-3-phosphate acyltransferase